MPRALPFRTLPALAAASLLALCAVAPGMATDTVADPPFADPPFADPRNKPMGDWSRMLPDLLPAIQACIGESADRPRVVLKAWPMNRGMVGVRMARTRDGAATQDCIATTGGRVDRLERPSENAEALPGQGAPSSFRYTPPRPASRAAGWNAYPAGRAKRSLGTFCMTMAVRVRTLVRTDGVPVPGVTERRTP